MEKLDAVFNELVVMIERAAEIEKARLDAAKRTLDVMREIREFLLRVQESEVLTNPSE